jgi:hypothetical protein
VNNNAAMNQLIVAGARRGERVGALARLAGSPPLETDTPRQERLNALLADREAAMQSSDADALAFTEHRIDRLFEEARAARMPAESEQGGEQPQPARFDGGVRGRRPFPGPGLVQESASQLMLRAMTQSRVERAERDADPGQTIIANNV